MHKAGLAIVATTYINLEIALVRCSGSLLVFLDGPIDFLVLAVEGLAGLLDGELPVELEALLVALAAPALDLIGELGLGRKAPLQARAREGREVQLDQVEPGAALGRVAEVEPVG